MSVSVDKHLSGDPDVVCRIYPEKQHLPPFTTLHIDEITLYANSFMTSLDKQLDMWVRLGERIIAAAQQARPDIPRSPAA